MSNTRIPRTVRFTDSEVDELRDMAQRLDMGWTRFVRLVALAATRRYRLTPPTIDIDGVSVALTETSRGNKDQPPAAATSPGSVT